MPPKKLLLPVAVAFSLPTSMAGATTIFTLADTSDLSLSHSSADSLASPPTAGSQTVGNGTFAWGSLLTDGGGNTATFASGQFSSADWGGTGTFTSVTIDVSAANEVDILGQYDGGFNTGTEFSRFFYDIGGGPVFFGEGVEDATATDLAVSVLALDVSSVSSMTVGFDYSHNGSSDFFNVDSLTVTVVPEPSAVVLGSIGLLGLLRRRR